MPFKNKTVSEFQTLKRTIHQTQVIDPNDTFSTDLISKYWHRICESHLGSGSFHFVTEVSCIFFFFFCLFRL